MTASCLKIRYKRLFQHNSTRHPLINIAISLLDPQERLFRRAFTT